MLDSERIPDRDERPNFALLLTRLRTAPLENLGLRCERCEGYNEDIGKAQVARQILQTKALARHESRGGARRGMACAAAGLTNLRDDRDGPKVQRGTETVWQWLHPKILHSTTEGPHDGACRARVAGHGGCIRPRSNAGATGCPQI